jgi:hypothetical protein
MKAHFKLRWITVILWTNTNLVVRCLMRLDRCTVKHSKVSRRATAKCSIPIHSIGSLRIPVHFIGSLRILVHVFGSLRIPVHFSSSFLRLISRNASSFLTFIKIVHDADFFDLKIPVFMSTPQHFSLPLFTSRGWRQYGEGCSERNVCFQILVAWQGSSRPSGWVRGHCHRAKFLPNNTGESRPYYSARKKFLQWFVTVKAATTMIQSAWRRSFVCYTDFISPISSPYSGA